MAKHRKTSRSTNYPSIASYNEVLVDIADLLESARRASARSVNAIMTATYWEIGRRIVDFEQGGEKRAEYGSELIKRLSGDLTKRFGRGYSERNLRTMPSFYVGWGIRQTLSAKSGDQTEGGNLSRTARIANPGEKCQTPSANSESSLPIFPLPWSHYVRLLSLKSQASRSFYEQEAIRGGWSIRQLDRQIDSQFYERTALSKNKKESC
jgi:hypothetical protein